MPIPDFQACMLPVLQVIADGNDWQMKHVTVAVADRFNLTEEERAQMLPSGQTRTIVNRVGWAKHYLKEAGLIESPKRGVVRISPDGTSVLNERPNHVNMKYLERFPGYVDFQRRGIKSSTDSGGQTEVRCRAGFR